MRGCGILAGGLKSFGHLASREMVSFVGIYGPDLGRE
jgi:hypothetical protein